MVGCSNMLIRQSDNINLNSLIFFYDIGRALPFQFVAHNPFQLREAKDPIGTVYSKNLGSSIFQLVLGL